jgi:glycosyltransferase involved in cell wall biosynthesis
LLSLPNDSEALAANLHRALTSDDTRRRLITSGTENVQRFSWEANANAHVDLYHRLVGGQ